MSVDPQRVQQVFLAAVDVLDPAARDAVLDSQCGHNQELRRRVEALLRAHDCPDELPGKPNGGDETILPAGQYGPGTVIAGRYKLREEIAEGGMGTVWVADQSQPVRRRVAIKLIKAGMDSRQVLSRFEAERQALALMDHPNIAKVLDGGMTDEGRPFFVMEYVKGVPITQFCDDARLPIKERLRLFVPVCQAVQHAHQKGIIHRDLKPSNILVCLYDGRPVPKVIDFGLAKAMHQPLTEQTLYTAHGLMVGTPLYMSPEQAEYNNLDIDTRADVYSLGVILYELLTGSTPLDRQRFKDAAWQEIVRLIKEQEPSKPSTKLSSSATLPSIAAQRNLEPTQLSRLVRGDLDWIVMKALEKERARRYETANGLARDVERFLSDQPVEACPPSAGYRFRKFARRNKVAFATVAAVATTLLIATGVSAWQAIRATRAEQRVWETLAEVRSERDRANRERDRAMSAEGLAATRLSEVEQERDRAARAEDSAKAEAVAAQAANKEKEVALIERTSALDLAQKNEVLARGRFYSAQMNLASQALRDGQHARAVELLESLRPEASEHDLRGFEWYHLYHLTHANVVRRWRAHHDTVLEIVWSPDGLWFASVAGGTVHFWDGRTGELRGSIPTSENLFWDLDLSADGRFLAGACSSGEVYVWDVAARREIHRWMAHPVGDGVRTIAISADGQQIATSASELLLWNLEGQQIAVLGNHSIPNDPNQLTAGSLTFSPKEQILAAATIAATADGQRNRVLVWDTSSEPKLLSEIPGVTAGRMRFSEEGETLWGLGTIEGQGTTASLLEIEVRQPTVRIAHSLSGPRILDGANLTTRNQLVTIDLDRTVRLRELSSGETSVMGAELAMIRSVAADPSGRFVACGDNDGWITLRDLQAPPAIAELRQNWEPGGGRYIDSLAYSPDGRRIFVGFWPLNIVDANTLALEETGPQGAIIAISPQTELVAARHRDGRIEIWDRQTRTVRVTIRGRSEWTRACFSSDGQYLATWHPWKDMTLNLWDAQSGQLLGMIDENRGGHCSFVSAAFSPHFPRLATGDQFIRTNIYDVATQRLIDSEEVVGQIVSVACVVYSVDGSLLAAGGDDGQLVLYDVDRDSGKLNFRSRLPGHPLAIQALAFSPDGSILVSASTDRTIRFWDVALGQERMTLEMNAKLLAFSPNGNHLAVVKPDNTLLVLKGSELPAARAHRSWRGRNDAKNPRQLIVAAFKSWSAGNLVGAENLFRDALQSWDENKDQFEDSQRLTALVQIQVALSSLYESLDRTAEAAESAREALKLADRYAELFPDPAEAQRRRTFLLTYVYGLVVDRLASQGQWIQASVMVQQVLELQPDSISSWYRLALLQLRQGDLPNYRATCEEIMRRFADRNDSITQDWLTWTALLGSESLADLSVPLEIATNLVSSFPTDPQPATTLGGLLYRTGKYAEAATALRNSIGLMNATPSEQSTDLYTWLLLAMTQWRLENPDEAREIWWGIQPELDATLAATSLWNRRATLEVLRAEAATLLGVNSDNDPGPPAEEGRERFRAERERLKSLRTYSAAVNANPTDAGVWLDRAYFYAKCENWELAAADWVKVVELSEDTFWQGSSRTLRCRELAAFPEIFDCVARLLPEEPVLWIGRAQHHLLRSQWSDAARAYEKAFRTRPLTDETVFEYAAALLLVGNQDEYQRVRDRVKANCDTPQNPMQLFIAARTFGLAPWEGTDHEQLVDIAWKYLDVEDQPWRWHALGLTQYRAGQFQQAIESLEKSNALNWGAPQHAQNGLVLAMAHYQLGNHDEAARWFRRSLDEIAAARPADPQVAVNIPPPDWIELEVLRAEATAIIAGSETESSSVPSNREETTGE